MQNNGAQKPDSIVRQEGMKLLLDHLGKVDAERFISLILKEPFDYTKWQQGLFEQMSLEELSDNAMDNYNQITKQQVRPS